MHPLLTASNWKQTSVAGCMGVACCTLSAVHADVTLKKKVTARRSVEISSAVADVAMHMWRRRDSLGTLHSPHSRLRAGWRQTRAPRSSCAALCQPGSTPPT